MIEWLRTKVFPEAVQAQSFGADARKFVSFEPSNQKGVDHLVSDVVFGDVTVEKENGRQVTESVVIKVQPSLEDMHILNDCDAQFHNEVLFHSQLIPLLKKYDKDNVLSTSFSELVYGKATNGRSPKEDVIIFKNLNKKGFKLTDEKLFLDEKHINLVLDRIAKFHGLSLKCQTDDPESFYNIVSQIKKPLRDLDGKLLPKNFKTLCVFRGIDALKNDPEYKDRLSDIYKHCEKAHTWLERYKGPSETLNVIVHGDFCRNNMMFKYDESGEPTEVAFFDTATIKYCSPTIDTSFFLFLHASPEVRRLYWDDFLRTYYDSLTRQLEGHPAKPSFETVSLDWRTKGLYGYYLGSFMLANVMGHASGDDWSENSGAEKMARFVRALGGSKATEYMAEMVRHMLDKGYVFEH